MILTTMQNYVVGAVVVSVVAVVLWRIFYLQQRLGKLHQQLNQEQQHISLVITQAELVPDLERQLVAARDINDQLQQRLNQFNVDIAIEKEKSRGESNNLCKLQIVLQQRESELADLRTQLSDKQEHIAELTTRLEEQQLQVAEKIQLLNDSRTELSNQFKTLAQEIFDEKGRIFSAKNSDNLHQVLEPFREQLHEFKKQVNDVYASEMRERVSLKHELEDLRKINVQMNQEAINLTRALKGDKKTQGNWGELVLERVLERSGLRSGVEYDTQGGFRDADNKLLKPDVIVHLPEGKDVVVDSKVSLVAYERYCNEENAQLQAQALKEHVMAVHQHITLLSDKDYTTLQGVRSLDFVLMFMPIESAFMTAFQADDELFNHAFERRIVVVTPTTLLATLRTIENIWRYERQNQNAQAIAERAGAVYDKLRGFVEDMHKIGVQLATVDSTYQAAMMKLTQGKGNLISQANRFVDLGVKVRKPLPKAILDRTELEMAEDEA